MIEKKLFAKNLSVSRCSARARSRSLGACKLRSDVARVRGDTTGSTRSDPVSLNQPPASSYSLSLSHCCWRTSAALSPFRCLKLVARCTTLLDNTVTSWQQHVQSRKTCDFKRRCTVNGKRITSAHIRRMHCTNVAAVALRNLHRHSGIKFVITIMPAYENEGRISL